MSGKYILDGHNVVPVDLMTWARWFETAERHVAKDQVGDVSISTVFLGLDHAHGGSPPLLFETMIFGGPHDGYQERCSTWEQAEAMHAKALELARAVAQHPGQQPDSDARLSSYEAVERAIAASKDPNAKWPDSDARDEGAK